MDVLDISGRKLVMVQAIPAKSPNVVKKPPIMKLLVSKSSKPTITKTGTTEKFFCHFCFVYKICNTRYVIIISQERQDDLP